MLIRRGDIKGSVVEAPREGKGILNKWDYIKEHLPCSNIITFSYLELEPNSRIGRHHHIDNFEVYCFIDGEGSADDNGTEVVVGPGDVLITNSGEYHSLTNIGASNLKLIAFIANS